MATTRSLSLWRRRSTSLLFARNIWSLCKNGPSPLPNSCYDFPHNKVLGPLNTSKKFWLDYYRHIHTSTPDENFVENPSENNEIQTSMDENENSKPKRKKLKGKRAVIKWLKHFRWKKKKEFERMTSEEKILYKLKLARGREERFINALKKIEPNFSKEAKHDPEILTPEEHFYFLKMGLKCKNYVPIGRRGIFQGVILNMHLHWKKHQTLKVIVKTFTKEEVKDIAAELARLSGGIVLDIVEDENEIIMYRGKNYVQPPTEIMSPKVTLSRKKAMDKSKYLEKLRMVRRDIPRLEQELESLHVRMNIEREIQIKPDSRTEIQETKSLEEYEIQQTESNCFEEEEDFDSGSENSENVEFSEEENLSDIFETDSEEGQGQGKEEMEGPVFLDVLERFNYEKEEEIQESFEEHLRKIGDVVKREDLCRKEINVSELDEIDRIFLSASSLLKKKR